MYQEKYWKEMYQLKVHVNYVELYLERSELIDRCINILLAVTSNSSICGWAIWQQYSFVWAVIIAASQLINSVKGFLPYKSRIKPLAGLLHELEELMIFAETRWFDVSESNLTDEEIHKLQFKIRSTKIKSLKKFFPSGTLPEDNKKFSKAENIARTYFNNFYSI